MQIWKNVSSEKKVRRNATCGRRMIADKNLDLPKELRRSEMIVKREE